VSIRRGADRSPTGSLGAGCGGGLVSRWVLRVRLWSVGLVAVTGGPPLVVGEVHGEARVLRNTRLPTRLTI
jgi:hypothetical protein